MSDLLQHELHPDADQLNAFAEGVLQERERGEMMAHLAECSQCREILFLVRESLPEQPVVPEPVSSWRRWLAPLPLLGAGAALVACAGLIAITLRTPRVPVSHETTARVEPPAIVQPSPPAPVEEKPRAAPVVMGAMSAPPPKVPAQTPVPPVLAMTPQRLMGGTIGGSGYGVPVAAPSSASAEGQGLGAGRGSAINLGSGAVSGSEVASAKLPAQVHGAVMGAAARPATVVDVAPLSQEAAPRSTNENLTVSAASADVETTYAADGAVIQQGKVENLPVDGRNSVNFAAMLPGVANMKRLPSKLPEVATTSSGAVILAADSAGSLFVSTNGGKHWKSVKPQWQGKVTQLALAGPQHFLADKTTKLNGTQNTTSLRQVSPPAKDSGAVTSDSAEAVDGAVFQLTTDAGVVWTSNDGRHWQRR